MYTDGGCITKLKAKRFSQKDAVAGFGVTILNELDEEIDKLQGKVILNPNHQHFVGALRKTNTTAEMTAIIEALIEAMDPKYADKDHIIIHTDNEYCMKLANGLCNARENRLLAATMLHMLMTLKERKRYVDVMWVKGHNDHGANDRADELATEACKSEVDKRGRRPHRNVSKINEMVKKMLEEGNRTKHV